MLRVKNLRFTYSRKQRPVIDGLSTDIAPGHIYGLLGLNGVGKTTLLNLIGGLLTPDSGIVEFNGLDTRRRLKATLGDIFIVTEEFSLPSVTIREYARTTGAFYPRFSEDDMMEYLDSFGISPAEKINNLSMGQQKKAYLSFAIATNTSLLLLDEPTNGLDLPGKKTLRGLLASNIDENHTVILSTHQIADIQTLIDHLIVMRDGDILLNASISDIASRFRFEVTSNPSILSKALYRQPIFSGNIVILPNDEGEDTEIDIESFFYFCSESPDTITRLML